MATNELEDVCQCPVCLERFTDPRVLPCQHCFCKDCLEDLLNVEAREGQITLNHEVKIVCPNCRDICKFENNKTISSLQKNFYLAQVLEYMHNKSPKTAETNRPAPINELSEESECSFCQVKLKTIATPSPDTRWEVGFVRCSTCHTLFCSTCYKSRHTDKNDENGFPSEHETMILKPNKDGQFCFFCVDHKFVLKYYCINCKSVCCIDCCLAFHRQHGLITVDFAAYAVREILESDIEEAKKKIKEIDGLKNAYHYDLSLVENFKQETIEREIEERKKKILDHVSRTLDEAQEHLINRWKEQKRTMINRIDKEIGELEIAEACTNSIIDLASSGKTKHDILLITEFGFESVKAGLEKIVIPSTKKFSIGSLNFCAPRTLLTEESYEDLKHSLGDIRSKPDMDDCNEGESDEEHTSGGSVISQDCSDEDLSDSADSTSEHGRFLYGRPYSQPQGIQYCPTPSISHPGTLQHGQIRYPPPRYIQAQPLQAPRGMQQVGMPQQGSMSSQPRVVYCPEQQFVHFGQDPQGIQYCPTPSISQPGILQHGQIRYPPPRYFQAQPLQTPRGMQQVGMPQQGSMSSQPHVVYRPVQQFVQSGQHMQPGMGNVMQVQLQQSLVRGTPQFVDGGQYTTSVVPIQFIDNTSQPAIHLYQPVSNGMQYRGQNPPVYQSPQLSTTQAQMTPAGQPQPTNQQQPPLQSHQPALLPQQYEKKGSSHVAIKDPESSRDITDVMFEKKESKIPTDTQSNFTCAALVSNGQDDSEAKEIREQFTQQVAARLLPGEPTSVNQPPVEIEKRENEPLLMFHAQAPQSSAIKSQLTPTNQPRLTHQQQPPPQSHQPALLPQQYEKKGSSDIVIKDPEIGRDVTYVMLKKKELKGPFEKKRSGCVPEYTREFLLQFQNHPMALKRPSFLPECEIALDSPHPPTMPLKRNLDRRHAK